MPEISQAELNMFHRYQAIGTVDEINKKVKDLETDNQSQRQQITDLKKSVPSVDQTVVSKEDGTLVVEYKALGTPKQIQARFKAGDEALEKAKLADQRVAATAFAKATGLVDDSVETLIVLPQLKEAKFEVKKGKIKNEQGVEIDGDIGYITLAGDGQKALTFSEAREQVPALKGLSFASGTTEPQRTSFVPQGGEKSKPGTIYENIRKEAAERQKKAVESRPEPKSVHDRFGMTKSV